VYLIARNCISGVFMDRSEIIRGPIEFRLVTSGELPKGMKLQEAGTVHAVPHARMCVIPEAVTHNTLMPCLSDGCYREWEYFGSLGCDAAARHHILVV
jgi:hypothetical protein